LTIKGIPKEAWVLITFSIVCTFGVSAVFPYIPIHGSEIGISVTIIGHLIVLYYLLQAITRIPLGRLADLVGHHKPIFLGSFFYLLAAAFFILSGRLWFLLFIGEFFLGLANSITWVTVPSYITDISGAIPIYTFSLGVGWLLGSPVGGYVKDGLGMVWVFGILLVASLILLVLSLIFYHLDQRSGKLRHTVKYLLSTPFNSARFAPLYLPLYPSIKSYLRGWQLLRSNRPLLIASSFSFLVFMTFGLGASILPLYLSEVGLTSFLIGILVALRTGTSTAVRLYAEKVAERVGYTPALVGSTILVGGSMIGVASLETFLPIAVLSAFWGIFGGIYMPIVFNMIADNTSREDRGIAMGLRGTFGTLGAAMGNWVFSFLAHQLSLSLALIAAGAFAAVGSILLGRLK